MKRIFSGVLVVALTALAVPAADKDDARTADFEAVQDVLYMGKPHPVLIRLRLSVGGRSAVAHWHASMGKYFDFLDRNGNKALDRSEANRAPTPAQMLQFFQGGLNFNQRAVVRGAPQPEVNWTDLDADRDGKATIEEFEDYYRKNGAGPIVIPSGGGSYYVQQQDGGFGRPASSDELSDRVFELLDTNKDGKLSRDELARSEQVLMKFDTNDDELVSAAELGLTPQNRNIRPTDQAAAVTQKKKDKKAEPPPSNLMLLPQDESGRKAAARLQLARDLVTRYDKDKDSKLTSEEIPFAKEQFTTLDRNKDGKLDALELSRWLAGKPAGDFALRLRNQGGAMMAATPRGGFMSPPEKADERSVNLEGVRINVVTPPSAIGGGQEQYFLQQFQLMDGDKKGFVTRKQVEGTDQQAAVLRSIFDLADRNNDSKLTEAEVKAMFGAIASLRGAQVNLAIRSTGQGLFQMLDRGTDGQLSIREMRSSWNRLEPLDRDKDAHISRTEFPQQFQLSVTQGPGYPMYQPVNDLPPFAPGAALMRGKERGPIWFLKMDRNGDGDISPVEWLSNKEDFAAIDTDKDGLISADEATAYDAKARKKPE